MQRETIIDKALGKVREQRGWRKQIALRAAVEVADVDTLMTGRDDRIVEAALSLTGLGGSIRAVDTSVKRFIEKIVRAAAWDKRIYAVFGPTGAGKTFTLKAIIPTIEEPVALVRITQHNRNSIGRITQDIHRALHVRVKGSNPTSSYIGQNFFAKLMDLAQTRCVVIIDEAQKLSDNSFELLRDIYDESQASLVLIGSTVFAERLAKKRISDEVFGQFLRRVDDRYELPHATPGDVKLFLNAYGIEIDKTDTRAIARKIGNYGDIDTLARAMRIIAGSVEEGELSWKKVGSGQIIDAIERITMLMTVEEEDGTEAQS